MLQPYTKYVKSYIKDTQDFLQKIPEQVVEESILVSFDVVNLYSNIPHNLGIEAISFWLNKYRKELPNRISKEFVLDGIKLILENNSFCFNDSYFLQTKGMVMGTKFAPIYATLVLAYLEEKLYFIQVEKEIDSNFRKYIEDNFKRFLEDCFIIFTRSDEELKKFHNLLSTLHLSIKFTIEKCRSHLSFLAHLSRRLIGELIVYQWSVVRRPSSSTMLKDLLLRNRWSDQSQILCGASLGRGNDMLFVASGSHSLFK